MQAIPTRYNGRQFRSRLEARWAAFFDLMKWNWDYEPIDLNGWIPDFVVGDFATGAYVEVKPIDFDAAVIVPRGERFHRRSRTELEMSVSGTELIHARRQVPETSRGFLVVGLRPFFEDIDGRLMFPKLGPVWEPRWNRLLLPSISLHEERGVYDLIVGSDGDYPGLMTGLDFNSVNGVIDQFCGQGEILPSWHEAGNIVQWKSPVRR
jgi:hypothetical protein